MNALPPWDTGRGITVLLKIKKNMTKIGARKAVFIDKNYKQPRMLTLI
jgi:hypothetical protein